MVFSCKKEQNFAICNNMNGLGGNYAKWNKSDREWQIPYNIIHMWKLKHTSNEYNRKEKGSQIWRTN